MARIFWFIPHLTGFPRVLEPTSGLDFQAQGPPFCLDVHCFKGPKWKQLTDNKKRQNISYYMASYSSMNKQDKPNPALWLATWAGKMELSCPLGTTCCILQEKFPWKPYNKSVIGQACFVEMAGYWPHSCKFIGLHSILVHKHTKKELG